MNIAKKTETAGDTSLLKKQLKAVVEINQALTGNLNESSVLDLIIQKLIGILDCKIASIWQWDETQRRLTLHTTTLSPLIRSMIEKVAVVHIEDIHLDMGNVEMEKNCILECVIKKKVIETDSLSCITVPYLAESPTQLLQKSMKIKHIMAIPLIVQGKVVGAFNPAWQKATLNEDERELLRTFADQIGSAVYQAKMFQQTRDQLTEIQQNYQDLQTIQQITQYTLSTLDLKLLSQKIVDVVPEKLGPEYLGATFLQRVRPQSSQFQVVSLTTSEVIRKLREALPMQLEGGITDFADERFPHEMRCAVLEDATPYIFDGLREFIGPTVPGPLIPAVEKIARIKTSVLYPAVFRNEVVGILHFGLSIPKEAVDERHIRMMESVANQVAIGINNASNFTELKTVNTNLEKAYADLKRLDMAKSEFLSIASHQLRTPLSAIRGYLSLVLDGDFGEVAESQKQVLSKTQDNVRRLVTLVNDLLSLARIEAGTTHKSMRVAKVDLRQLIDQTVDELKLKAMNKELDLVWQRPFDPVMVELDAGRIEQVITNLVDNAIHYTERGQVEILLEDEGSEINLSVRDSGIGIDPESLDNMFSKFYRSPEAVKVRPDGTGIGLYVAKIMVDSHGGKIWVDSQPGVGSTFHVTLPKRQAEDGTIASTLPAEGEDLDALPQNHEISLSDIFRKSYDA